MTRSRWEIIAIFFLIMSTLAVFWQVKSHDFVNYDDQDYVTQNPHVRAGWTIEGFAWAFKSQFHRHWHPLTWLSHMTDWQFFGPNPAWHHLTSLFLHIVNTLLLFLIFERMTGAPLRSVFVAILFALHPLHVEPVAWVAGRKDVLSAFFWLLTMWAYIRYSSHPGFIRYLTVFTLFVLGLMAKPMAVTLPFVLLLMDYWPLERFRHEGPIRNQDLKNQKQLTCRYKSTTCPRLIWEKLLFFIVLGVSAVVTLSVMHRGARSFLSLSNLLPGKNQIANTLASYMSYIGKMLWPANLAVPYPGPGFIPVWQTAGAGIFLILVSVLAILLAKRKPYLIVGWLWYLVTLLPVIGIVKFGPQKIADRYTYIPLIGLFIIIGWGVPDIFAKWRYRRFVLAISAGMVILGLMLCSWFQVGYWKNGITLFKQTVSVTDNNWFAHNNLGNALARQGRLNEAIEHYTEALKIRPGYAIAHDNLGATLARQGNYEEAIKHYGIALKIKPDYAEAHNNLAVVLKKQGNLDEAITHFVRALDIKPDYAIVHNNLANTLAQKGWLKEAVEHYLKALLIDPDNAWIHNNLGKALARLGRLEEAIDHFSRAVRIKPDHAGARRNLEFGLRLMEKSAGVP
ncbi:MAG: tetratricopeptide repeat protein [Desulfobacterales bacterium]|nr:tetratricopeptide repeat protein [Desulfobacterales bacterium]